MCVATEELGVLDRAYREANHITLNAKEAEWRKALMDHEKVFMEMHRDLGVLMSRQEELAKGMLELQKTQVALRECLEHRHTRVTEEVTKLKTTIRVVGGVFTLAWGAILAWMRGWFN